MNNNPKVTAGDKVAMFFVLTIGSYMLLDYLVDVDTMFMIPLYFLVLLVGIPLFYILYPYVLKENGIIFSRYPYGKNSFGSFANPENVTEGFVWTPIMDLVKEYSNKEDVYFNNFKFDKEYAEKSKMLNFVKNYWEKKKIYIPRAELAKGMLIIGKAGGGKTELYFSLLNQKFYNRAIIHQIKSGDFITPYYRKNIDIILNPYDQRSHLWDIMSEESGIISAFFLNYMNAVMGDKKDFFSASANRIFKETMIKIATIYKDEDSATKWLVYVHSIKELVAEMQEGAKGGNKDVGATMEGLIEPLEIMAWQMQDPKQKKFVIADFFKRKNQCKLILDNNPTYTAALTPLFSAFMACIAQKQVTLKKTKTDLTLYALDEYLSLSEFIDAPTKKIFHTLVRDKGGVLCPAIQYLPKDEEFQKLLTSSAFAWIFFGVIEKGATNLLKETIGDTEYFYQEASVTETKDGRSISYSTKTANKSIVNKKILSSLAKNYEHLILLHNDAMIYKGYTPQAELKVRAKDIVPVDMSKFDQIKYINEDTKKLDVNSLKFESLFKVKKRNKLEEYKLFKEFQKAKSNGTVESFAKDKNLKGVKFELMFEDYIPNDKVIDSKMKILSVDDRFKLLREWQSIDENDHEAQVAFIESHNLWGACPSIFEGLDKSIEELTDL